MHKNMKKKMHFTLQLMIYLTVQPRSAPVGKFDGAPKDALRELHKDAQKGALEVVLELHLWLHLWFLLMQ